MYINIKCNWKLMLELLQTRAVYHWVVQELVLSNAVTDWNHLEDSAMHIEKSMKHNWR